MVALAMKMSLEEQQRRESCQTEEQSIPACSPPSNSPEPGEAPNAPLEDSSELVGWFCASCSEENSGNVTRCCKCGVEGKLEEASPPVQQHAEEQHQEDRQGQQSEPEQLEQPQQEHAQQHSEELEQPQQEEAQPQQHQEQQDQQQQDQEHPVHESDHEHRQAQEPESQPEPEQISVDEESGVAVRASEPPQESDSILVVVKLPTGRQLKQAFAKSDEVARIYAYVDGACAETQARAGDQAGDQPSAHAMMTPGTYALVSPTTRRTFKDQSLSLEEAGVENRSVLHVEVNARPG